MPEVRSRQRRRRRRTQKRRQTRAGCALWIGVALLLCALGMGWLLHMTDRSAPLDLSYEVEGKPTIDAHFIDQVLAFYGSPAQGKGQALYNLGVTYGIDPVYALAFFMHESSFGTTGVARVTHSLGNIRVTPGYQDFQGYRRYRSWEEGFEDWYRLIKIQYIEKWSLTTVDQIVPVYAPSADHNDVDAYIRAVEQAVDTWRGGSVQIEAGAWLWSGSGPLIGSGVVGIQRAILQGEWSYPTASCQAVSGEPDNVLMPVAGRSLDAKGL